MHGIMVADGEMAVAEVTRGVLAMVVGSGVNMTDLRFA